MAAIEVATSCCAGHSGSLPVEAAWARALDGVVPVDGVETVPLRSARGRVTAAAVTAPHALPPFNQSAMDGYAVRTSDFINGAATFPIVARRAAGPQSCESIPDSPAAIRIFTGAAVPVGFDAVVMQEDCTRCDAIVVVSRRPALRENIRMLGEDVSEGATILSAGVTIDTRHIAILAAAGVSNVRVRRCVRVALFSTGNELREPHEPLAFGEIHDCNRVMLLSLLDDPTIELTDLGRIPDDPAVIAETFKMAACEFDIVLSTGGVSVGEEDHVRSAVASAGGKLTSLKANIKPGKPVSIGRLADTNLIGLPGNPVSALVTFLWFARPIVSRRMGIDPREPRSLPAVADFRETRHAGRDEFVPVAISGRDQSGRYLVARKDRGGSARLSALLGADGLARIPGHLTNVDCGHDLSFYPFEGSFGL